ncbi:MAG: hypothetical protein WCH99_17610, partial [Verrucomicrobiota bacterium]
HDHDLTYPQAVRYIFNGNALGLDSPNPLPEKINKDSALANLKRGYGHFNDSAQPSPRRRLVGILPVALLPSPQAVSFQVAPRNRQHMPATFPAPNRKDLAAVILGVAVAADSEKNSGISSWEK